LSQSSLSTDIANNNSINLQPYNNDSDFSASGYISKARRRANEAPSSTALKFIRTFGYTDSGFCRICNTATALGTLEFAPFDGNDIDRVTSIGFYPLHATTNRFANTFINRRLFVVNGSVNDDVAETIIPYGFSNPGHPLTVDYEANIETIPATQFNDAFDLFRYDVLNPYNNTANGETVKRSPVYKTRYTSIICDSGAIDQFGNLIHDYNYEAPVENGHAPKSFSKKRKVIGAIDNPWYASLPGSVQNGGVGPSHAETVITKTATGIKLCIKLKNFRDYILTDDQIPTQFPDSYESLMNASNPRNNRFLKFKNSLRLVIFSGAYNSNSDDLTFGQIGQTPYTALRQAAEKHVGNRFEAETAPQNKYTLRYGCTNSSCSCANSLNEKLEGTCNSCFINDLDKETNAYGATDLQNLVCMLLGGPDTQLGNCLGCVKTITRHYSVGDGSIGIGSFLTCTCGAAGGSSQNCTARSELNGVSSLFNCRNCSHGTPCSCKTSTLNLESDIEGGTVTCPAATPCDFCNGSSCRTPPGGILPPGDCFALRTCSSCPSGCNLLERLNEITSGGAIIKGTDIVQKFFAEYGYIEGEDFWIVNNPAGAFPIVVWKLLPTIETNGSVTTEKYNFPLISPPPYMVAPVGGDIVYYHRNTVCGPHDANTDQTTINNCGINAPLNPNVSCTNFCELTGQSCTNSVVALANTPNAAITQFISNIARHNIDSDGDTLFEPEENRLSQIAASCVSNFTSTTQISSKRIYLTETEFICVDMDCLSIDCTQFEDCAS